MTRALLVGFAPEAVDLSNLPVDVDTLRKMIEDGHARVRAAGYEIVYGWIGTDQDEAVAEVRRVLTEQGVDIVMIGNGVRGDPQYTELFERLVNITHEFAPRALAFNADPGSALVALLRNS